MKPITAHSHEGRALLALRLPGGITTHEAVERWPSSGTNALTSLVRMGLAKKVDDTFYITEAGRAACPFRNPAAAQPATPPEVFSMPRGSITKGDVFAAVVAAGPAGITRAVLTEQLGASIKSISNHLDRLVNVDGATVARLDRGLYVAQKFIGADGLPVKAAESKPDQETGDDLDKWVPEPLATDIDGISLAVDHHDAEDLSAAERAQQMALIEGEAVTTTLDAIAFNRAATTEFAFFSNGVLTINDGPTSVKLSPQVAVKMRRFLGQLKEAA